MHDDEVQVPVCVICQVACGSLQVQAADPADDDEPGMHWGQVLAQPLYGWKRVAAQDLQLVAALVARFAPMAAVVPGPHCEHDACPEVDE